MEEGALQQAIMTAINSVMSPKGKLIQQIADAMVEETVKPPDSVMTLGEINRSLEKLEAEFDALLHQSDSAEKNADRFKKIANEMASLKKQREKLSAQLRNNQATQERVRTIKGALDHANHYMIEWDEEMIRQLVHTVKVISADRIRVYLHDGTEIDQAVSP